MMYSLHAVDFLDINRFVCKENRVSYKAANPSGGGSALNHQKVCWVLYPELNIRDQKNTATFSASIKIKNKKF